MTRLPTQVLGAVQLPVDVLCAADASDLWDTQEKALIADAVRAHRRSCGDSADSEEAALAVLQALRQRAKEEPSRRALMRSRGVCPRAALIEKAFVGRSGEGKLAAQTVANEWEAKTFIPVAGLAERLEAARPELLDCWHPLDEGHVAMLARQTARRPRDFLACAEVAAGLAAEVKGIFVGRLALAGLSRDFPFLIQAGLDHFVCDGCGQWVPKKEARLHNVRCVGDAAGRARVFRQPAGEGLGLVLAFKHVPKSKDKEAASVELQAEALMDAAICRACWACYWAPDELRCAWRLARRSQRALQANRLPPPPLPPAAAEPAEAPADFDGDDPALGVAREAGEAKTELEDEDEDEVAGVAAAGGSAAVSADDEDGGWSPQDDEALALEMENCSLLQDFGDDPFSSLPPLPDSSRRRQRGASSAALPAAAASPVAPTEGGDGAATPKAASAHQEDATAAAIAGAESGTGLSAASSQRFALRGSHDALPARQPKSFVRPMSAAQLRTLGWMQQREAEEGGYESTQVLRQAISETDVCLEVRLQREYKACRGGTLADALGYGKTACTTALVAESRGSQSLPEMLSLHQWPEIAASRVLTNATLVVTPPNLFDQWLREIRRLAGSSLRVLPVPNHGRLKTLVVADFVAADIVLVTFRFFFSEAYQRYFDELTKPGLKVWDEGSIQRRASFLQKRQRNLASKGRGRGRGGALAASPAAALGVGEVPGVASAWLAPGQVKREAATVPELPPTVPDPGSGEMVSDEDPEVAPAEASAGAGRGGKGRGRKGRGRGEGTAPALQVSKYYLELKASKDYLPQRYVDLERRTRRLLREADADELAGSPALFEMFHFKRIIFDEFQEVVKVSSESAAAAVAATREARAPFYALHALQGHYHWGLTGTPFLSSAAAVAHMASLLRVFIPYDDDGEAQRFLDTWVLSYSWDDASTPLEEHLVEVELTGPEHALYLFQRNLLSDQGAEGATSGQSARAAERKLLQLCTHFDPDGRAVGEDAETLLAQAARRQRELLEGAEKREQACEEQREEVVARSEAYQKLLQVFPQSVRESSLVCAHGPMVEVRGLAAAAVEVARQSDGGRRLQTELVLVEGDLRRLAQAAMEWKTSGLPPHSDEGCASCKHLTASADRLKQLGRTKAQAANDQKYASMQLRFLEAVLRSLDALHLAGSLNPAGLQAPPLLECRMCMRDIAAHDAAILPCGHVFHEACATAAVSSQRCCPQCRRPTTTQMLTSAHRDLKGPAAAASTADPGTAALRKDFGSKLAKVVGTILDIKRREGEGTKCLVFIQWDAVAAHLERGLQAAGVPPLSLRGHATQRQRALAKFVDGTSIDSSVLLLSLEHSPPGMNLVCAHHLLLVHPLAERAEDAANQELQAIGRVRRQGQRRTVHVYRFVAKGTVEEALVRQHQALADERRSATAAVTAAVSAEPAAAPAAAAAAGPQV